MSNPPTAQETNDFVLSYPDAALANVLPKWQNRLSEVISSLRVIPNHSSQPFSTYWRHLDLGQLDINIIKSPSQRVIHDVSLQEHHCENHFELLYMDSNGIRLGHCDAEFDVKEGDFVLLDHRKTYLFESEKDTSTVTLHFDKKWIERWVPDPEKLIARPISGNSGWASPLGALLRTIATEGLDDVYVSRSVIGDQIGSLMALLPGQQPITLQARGQQKIFQRIRQVVKDNFHDPDLSPCRVAEFIGISKRHLYGICASGGVTFTELLMNERLNHAKERLDDVRYCRHRICDIAFSCGFTDASHFARRFRMEFGVTPKKYREINLGSSVGLGARL